MINAQNVTIQTLAFQAPTPSTSCTNTLIDISCQVNCINAVHTGNTVTVSGSTITIDVNYTIGIICLGALSYPTHTVNLGMLSPGTYTVVVNGTWNGPTVHTQSTSLFVKGCCPAVPSFTYAKDTICVGDSLHFTNTTTGSISHEWFENNVSVGTQLNYGKRYNTAGTYRIRLEATDGTCTDSLMRNIIVKDYPVINLGNDTSICPGEPITLDAGSMRDSVLWSTSSTNQTINVGTAGSYHVRVSEFGCDSRDTINVSLFPQPPSVNFGPDTTLCDGDSLILDATSAGVTYLWQDNATNPTYTVKTAGTYAVELEDMNTCTSNETITVMYYDDPEVSIFVAPGNDICNGDPYTFTAFPLNQGTILGYNWLVNGQSTTAPSAPTFTGPVDYGDTVSVEMLTDLCATASYPVPSNEIVMKLNPAPKVITGKSDVLENTTETYVVPISSGSSYLWKVKGGTIVGDSTSNIVTVKWGTPIAVSYVTLIETDSKNCERANGFFVNILSTIGIESHEELNIDEIYPNPSNKLVNMTINSSQNADITVELTDISGKLVRNVYSGSINSERKITFDVSELESGFYFVRVRSTAGYQSTKRLIVE